MDLRRQGNLLKSAAQRLLGPRLSVLLVLGVGLAQAGLVGADRADAAGGGAAAVAAPDPRRTPADIRVVRLDSAQPGAKPAFELRCDGVPFRLKGACGVEAIAEVAAAGGNAVRSYSAAPPGFDESVLDFAHAHGVKVLVGLAMAKPTGGFYRDPAKVAAQFAALSAQIDRWKSHAAVLAWGIGNEIDPVTLTPEEARPVYAAIEALAAHAHKVDPHHPTVSVHAGSSPEKMRRIRDWAPSIDIVACNSYAHVGNVAANVAESGWTGPYLVTEYAIHQPMEQRPPHHATPWGSVIEPLSRAKAERLLEVYRNHLLPHPNCLGGFVFKAAKGAFRVTHTWYPLLHDDAGTLRPTPSYDAMRAAWRGLAAPEWSGPLIEAIALDGRAPAEGVVLADPEATVEASVVVSAPPGARLVCRAEIRPDVSLKENRPPSPLTGIALRQDPKQPTVFRFRAGDLPPGEYRLYYYVSFADVPPVGTGGRDAPSEAASERDLRAASKVASGAASGAGSPSAFGAGSDSYSKAGAGEGTHARSSADKTRGVATANMPFRRR